MENDALEQEMNYPNPVERSDLPVKRRRLPRLLLGMLGILVLLVVFLPQILSTRVGRKFVVSYIARKTNSPVTIESVKTSWFGGTTIRHLTIKDHMGRRIGFKQLHSQASLWKLVRGSYEVGDCTIDDLHVEYVIDDGRGKDTVDFMKGPPPGSPPTAAPPAPWNKDLPKLSGKIKINGGTVVLWRGTVQPKLYDVTWERAKFIDVKGEFDVASLDQPWKYSLTATSVEDGQEGRGTIASSGTIDLGANGKFNPDELVIDAVVNGANLRGGPIGAMLVPTASSQEARHAVGQIITKLKLAVKAGDGEIEIEELDVQGGAAKIAGRAVIDVSSTPAQLTIATSDGPSASGSAKPPVTIALGVSKRAATHWFVYFNPFLREAIDGSGVVTLTVDHLAMPLDAKTWKTMTAAGKIKAERLKLARVDELRNDEAQPENLASQLALVTGDTMESVPLAAEGKFSIAEGDVRVETMPTRLGPLSVALAGSSDLANGELDFTVQIAAGSKPGPGAGASAASLIGMLASAQTVFQIKGTVEQPRMLVTLPMGNLPVAAARLLETQIADQVAKLRAREAQRQMHKSEQEIDDMLKPLKGMDQKHRAAAATAPATRNK